MKYFVLGFCGIAALAAALSPAQAQQGVMQACGAEWQAAKAGGSLPAGATWNDFLAQCRVRHAAPAVAPAPAAPAAAKPAPAPAAAAKPAAPAPTVAKPSVGFGSERDAQAACPTDMVVWVNEKSDVYHFKGARYYGATKSGGYMCEREAVKQGNHAAKDEKRPQQ